MAHRELVHSEHAGVPLDVVSTFLRIAEDESDEHGADGQSRRHRQGDPALHVGLVVEALSKQQVL
jgi:hypothetical protein